MQSTNVIGIDPSTTCTGLCINGKPFCISPEEDVYNKKMQMNKWYSIAEKPIDISTFKRIQKSKKFVDSEIQKITQYDNVTDIIINLITTNINEKLETVCVIEGFSYNASAGHLIDLVTFSTLLRYKILKQNFSLVVVPPATLKVLSAKLTYSPVDVGKKKEKLEWRNRNGVSGGKFTKHDMLATIAENNELNDDWSKFIKEYYSDLSSMKSIPKPFEDVNDAYLLFKTFTI